MKNNLFSELMFFHYLMDFVFQSDRIAAHKRSVAAVRLEHVAIYHSLFVVWLALRWWAGHLTVGRALLFLVVSFTSHYLIDSRAWGQDSKWAGKPMVVDQGAHAAMLWIGSYILQA